MARGIEELAEMQVTGPVQGGDMVMKPDQAPVGAAALLNKMSRQNTPGIFKLPMPDKQMPDFMKVAAEGVEQQISQGGDTISIMAGELLRQGFDPIVIKGMDPLSIQILYERTFGSERDADEMSNAVQDLRDKVKTVETFAPEDHELAYITPKEAELLKMTGGSGEANPVTGIKQYPGGYGTIDTPWGAGGTTSTPGAYESGGGEGFSPGAVSEGSNAVAQAANLGVNDQGQNLQEALAASGQSNAPAMVQGIINAQNAQVAAEKEQKKKTTDDKGLWDFLNQGSIGLMMKGTDALADFLRTNKIENVKDFIKDEDSAAGWANLLNQFASSKNPEGAFQSWLEDEEGAWKDTMLGELKDDPGMEDKTKTTFDEVLEFMKTKHGGSEEWKKRFGGDKVEYWKDNTPQTGGQAENMASNLTMNDIEKARDSGTLTAKEARRLSYELQQARDTVSEQQDKGQDRHPGTGAPVEKIIEEDEVVTTTTDPRAGAFNVGGTMPYTHDVATGGAEMDVPLGRRFEIDKAGKYRGTAGGMDLNEAMQYATLGGYGQLEPFQEYLARRRKHLGEEEPQYFDEEGNVIYSEVT